VDPEQFRKLHARYWEALKRYVHEAERMCELFGQCLPEPSSLADSLENYRATHPRKQCPRQLHRGPPAAFRGGSDRLRLVKLNHRWAL